MGAAQELRFVPAPPLLSAVRSARTSRTLARISKHASIPQAPPPGALDLCGPHPSSRCAVGPARPGPARLGSSSPSRRLAAVEVAVSPPSLAPSAALTSALSQRNELSPAAAAAGADADPEREAPGLAAASAGAGRLGGAGRRRAQMPAGAGSGGVGGSVVDGGGRVGRAGGGRALEPVGVGLVPPGGAAPAQRHGAGGAGAGVHGARTDTPARGGAGHARPRHYPPLR